MNKWSDLAGLCQGCTVYIQTHNFPDPDAIASAFGLQRLLAAWGVESKLCYDGKIDKLSASKMLEAFRLEMLPYESLAGEMKETDRIICVDTNIRISVSPEPAIRLSRNTTPSRESHRSGMWLRRCSMGLKWIR